MVVFDIVVEYVDIAEFDTSFGFVLRIVRDATFIFVSGDDLVVSMVGFALVNNGSPNNDVNN